MKKCILFIATLLILSSCKKDTTIAIGQHLQGGIIFYIDSTGNHGLIASLNDQSDGIPWSNGNDTIRTNASGYAIGTGQSNTKIIVNMLGQGRYAAIICEDLVLDGYNDWYLPSSAELNLLYLHKDTIGGFAQAYYWSSTDMGGSPHAFYAVNQDLATGSGKMNNLMMKASSNHVRAIRSF